MANELALMKRDVVDVVLKKVNEFQQNGEVAFPENYSPQNAMKQAWLILQDTKDKSGNLALEVCTRDSVANALLDMVVQGLSPAKKQCYFIVYGDKLSLTRSYFGTIAVTKRLNGVKNVISNCIFEGDTFKFKIDLETGTKIITEHEQSFKNININKIRGAYAIVITDDGGPNFTEVMTIEQIQNSWLKSRSNPFKGSWKKTSKGKNYFEVSRPLDLKPDSTHAEYTDQMSMRTVINRACKMFTNTSDDSDLLIEAFNNTTANEYKQEETVDDVQAQVTDEIKETEPVVIDVPEEKQTIVEEPEQMDLKGTPFAK